jgi:hypothetical protein
MRSMLVVSGVVLAAGCASAGCASGGLPARTHDAAPLFRLATVDTPSTDFEALFPKRAKPVAATPVPATPLPPAPGARDGVSVELRLEDAQGSAVLAPRIIAFHGKRARVEMFEQAAYVREFDVERKDDACIVDPVIGIAQDGVFVEFTSRPGARGTDLAWSIRVARLRRPMDEESWVDAKGNRLTLQLPTWDRSEAEGLRSMAPGVWGLLARLPDVRGGSVAVLARVTPEKVEFSSADEDARDIGLIDPTSTGRPSPHLEAEFPDSLPARAERAALEAAPGGRIDLRAVAFPSDLAAGSVVEAAAAEAALSRAEAVEPGDLRWVTGLVPGARAACLLDESFIKDYDLEGCCDMRIADAVPGSQVSGLSAEVGRDGVLGLSWTTTPRRDRFTTTLGSGPPVAVEVLSPETYRASVVPGAEPRLVVLARLPGKRALGVLVRFRAEDPPAR